MKMLCTVTLDDKPDEVWTIYKPSGRMYAGWYTKDKKKFQESMSRSNTYSDMKFDPTSMTFPTRKDIKFFRVLIPMILFDNKGV